MNHVYKIKEAMSVLSALSALLSVGNIDDEEVNGVIKLTEKAVPKWTALEGYLNLYNYEAKL